MNELLETLEEEWLTVAIFACIMVGSGIAVIYQMIVGNSEYVGRLDALARKNRLNLSDDGKSMTGERHGVALVVEREVRHMPSVMGSLMAMDRRWRDTIDVDNQLVLEVRAVIEPPGPAGITVSKGENMFHLTSSAVATGDAAFDVTFNLRASDADAACLVMTSPVRACMLKAHKALGDFEVDHTHVRWSTVASHRGPPLGLVLNALAAVAREFGDSNRAYLQTTLVEADTSQEAVQAPASARSKV